MVERTRAEVKQEGFGVLSEIDVQGALHEKLGHEMEPYLILGACNLELATRGLEHEPDLVCCCPATSSFASTGAKPEWRQWSRCRRSSSPATRTSSRSPKKPANALSAPSAAVMRSDGEHSGRCQCRPLPC